MHYDIVGPPNAGAEAESYDGGDKIGENSRPLEMNEAPANYKGCYRINEHHNAYPDEIDSCKENVDTAGA